MFKAYRWILSGLLVGSLGFSASASAHEQDYGHYGAITYDPWKKIYCLGIQGHSPEEAVAIARGLGCGDEEIFTGQGWLVAYAQPYGGGWTYNFNTTRDGPRNRHYRRWAIRL